MEQICEEMPKVELHAHLNGSITDEICLDLIRKNKSEGFEEEIIILSSDGSCTIAKCFEKFAQIHRLIRSTDILRWVTFEVIRNFSKENVIYLELRTTPKVVNEISSKDAYMEAVIQGILESQSKLAIVVKLLISIDRKMGYADGEENINLAEKWAQKYPKIVIGIDLSGDPTKGNCDWIMPLLIKARSKNFQITCHLPEIANPDEAKQFLTFAPERVGHGLHIHPEQGGSDELWQMLKSSKIPMEICITSNIIAGNTIDEESHHVRHLYLEKMPHMICTDDCGIFNTTLNNEYKKYLKILKGSLGPNELKQLCLSTIEYTFAAKEEKVELKELTIKWWTKNADWIALIN